MSPSQVLDGANRQVFLGTFVHSKSRAELEYMHDTAVYVDENGVIAKVEKSGSDTVEETLKDLGWDAASVDRHLSTEGQFFFPGLIGEYDAEVYPSITRWVRCANQTILDTHVHASQYPNVGIFGKTTLLDWLEKYTFPLESSLKDLNKARRVYSACVRRTLAHGTTTAAYYATTDVAATNLLADLCLKMGQRAFVGRVSMDNPDLCPDYYRDASAQASAELTEETIQHIQSADPGYDIVSPIVTPRFAPSCTSEAMHHLSALQRKHDLPVQTHVSENKGEIALVASMFPESTSYADVYDRHGLLTPRTILAHAVHLTDAEADVVAARGAKVSHCACSNSSLTSGAARVRWLWGKGIEVGLGTDMSGGYSSSVLEAARQAALVSRHVAMGEERGDGHKLTVDEVLYLATRGGAICVGLEDKIGGFEEGKHWDAQLIGMRTVGSGEGEDGEGEGESEDSNVDLFGWEDWEERMAKWLYGGDDRNTKKVWVKGRLVHSRRGSDRQTK